MKRVLLKITLLAAFAPDDMDNDLVAETMGDAAAELVREAGALTCAAEYERSDVTVPDAYPDDTDALVDHLDSRFPSDGLMVGPLHGLRMLGRNGTFKKARLVRVPHGRFEIWLGHDNERYPLLTIPADKKE